MHDSLERYIFHLLFFVCTCTLYTCVEKWCMTAIEIQASQEAVRRGTLRASDTNAWKPLSAHIWTRALLRSQPTWKVTKHIYTRENTIINTQEHRYTRTCTRSKQEHWSQFQLILVVHLCLIYTYLILKIIIYIYFFKPVTQERKQRQTYKPHEPNTEIVVGD